MHDFGVAFVFWAWAYHASLVRKGEIESIHLFLPRGVSGVERQFVLWHVVGNLWILQLVCEFFPGRFGGVEEFAGSRGLAEEA